MARTKANSRRRRLRHSKKRHGNGDSFNSFQEHDPALEKISKLAQEVSKLQGAYWNAKEMFGIAAGRVPIHIHYKKEVAAGGNVLCEVVMAGVTVALGQGKTKKRATIHAAEAALKVIMMPEIQIRESVAGKRELQVVEVASQRDDVCRTVSARRGVDACQVPERVFVSSSGFDMDIALSFNDEHGIALSCDDEQDIALCFEEEQDPLKFLEQFIVIEPLNAQSSRFGSLLVLQHSINLNQVKMTFEYTNEGGTVKCVIRFDSQVVAEMRASTQKKAKTAACDQCVRMLKNRCWMLKIKQPVDSNHSITREEVQNRIKFKSDAISQDNIGSMLLQKMGWQGGGLGKDGTGIVEPVVLSAVFNRKGVGFQTANGVAPAFHNCLKEIIQRYATESNGEDLLFSNEFDDAERCVICSAGKKLRLFSTVRGKGQNCYVSVSRKMSASEIFDYVKSCGGETPKYKLLPPGSDQCATGLLGDFSSSSKRSSPAISMRAGKALDDHQRQISPPRKNIDMKHAGFFDYTPKTASAFCVPVKNSTQNNSNNNQLTEKSFVSEGEVHHEHPLSASVTPILVSNLLASMPQRSFSMNHPSSASKFDPSEFLEGFIVVEHTPARSKYSAFKELKRSCGFNNMQLRFQYINQNNTTHCIISIKSHSLAEGKGDNKSKSREKASAECLKLLRGVCWVLQIKQNVDSETRVSRSDIERQAKLKLDLINRDANLLNDIPLNQDSMDIEPIKNIPLNHDNSDNKLKLVQNMSWSEKGVTKDSSGFHLSNDLKKVDAVPLRTPELSASFKQCLRETVQSYASSSNGGDLIFTGDFMEDERRVIIDEGKRHRLCSNIRGKGPEKYLHVFKKRSANQVYEYVMSCGGETAKYKLIPPGFDERFASSLGNCDSANTPYTGSFVGTSRNSTPTADVFEKVAADESMEDEKYFPIVEKLLMPHVKNHLQLSLSRSDSKSSLLSESSLPDVSEDKLPEVKSCFSRYKQEDLKCLEEFIVIENCENLPNDGAFVILNRCAKLNNVQLSFKYTKTGRTVKCALMLKGKVMAEEKATSKKVARRSASKQCLRILKEICWVLKVKQYVDSNKAVSRDEVQAVLKFKLDQISLDNVCTKSCLIRDQDECESVGLVSAAEGMELCSEHTDVPDFNQCLKEVVQNYATSGDLGDLVFSCEFNDNERKIIYDEGVNLKLLQTERGTGKARYIYLSKTLSARQILEYVKSCGGETPKYKLQPPGSRDYTARIMKSCTDPRFSSSMSSLSASQCSDDTQRRNLPQRKRITRSSYKLQNLTASSDKHLEITKICELNPHVIEKLYNIKSLTGKEIPVLGRTHMSLNNNFCSPSLSRSDAPSAESCYIKQPNPSLPWRGWYGVF